MESYWQLRDRLLSERPKPIFTPAPPVTLDTAPDAPFPLERAFVISPGNGKHYVTGKVKTEEWKTNANHKGFTYVTGRYAQADNENGNNDLLTTDALKWGMPTVAHGPVNILHNERQIVGSISEAHMVENDPDYGTHITTCNVLWKYLFPGAVQEITRASDNGELWQSMEMCADRVKCASGCDSEFDYVEWKRNKAIGCEHLLRGGIKQYVNPTFLASGLILNGTAPGWQGASIEVLRQTAQIAEENELYTGNMTRNDAETLVSSILSWANDRDKLFV